MKTIAALFASCVLLSAAVSLAVSKLLVAPAPAPTDAARTDDLRVLRKSQEDLAAVVQRIEETLDEIARAERERTEAAENAAAPMPSSATTDAAPATDVARAEAAAAPTETENLTLDDAVDVLLDPARDEGEKQALWGRLAAQGLLDDAVAWFEERAAAHPQDPDAQVDAAGAYLQKLFTVNEVAKASWAMKADAAYDRALALDPNHWEGRFSKAVALSFWPPVTGMQAKAVEQFEMLRAQQEAAGSPQERHAQTYVYLGNLYASQGNKAKAAEVWRRGAELHPQSEELGVRAREAAASSETGGVPVAPAR